MSQLYWHVRDIPVNIEQFWLMYFVLLDKQTNVLALVLQTVNAESQDIELSDVIAVGLKKES
jgi:hypothetical protein